jgi:hypothetical protein|tara:strand:+ start:174 stop:452 length:279 start_codon:yes stop_codon:yes gene_type:complete
MYYDFLVGHLDAPFLLLSAVSTGLIIKIFYTKYQDLALLNKTIISIIFFMFNALIAVPMIVYTYRWVMVCGLYAPIDVTSIAAECSDSLFNL